MDNYPKILANTKPATLTELYTTYKRWCQGSSARNAHSHPVDVAAPCASSWCLTGALNLIYPEQAMRAKAVARLRKAINPEETWVGEEEEADDLEEFASQLEEQLNQLMSWNDRPETTFKAIRWLVVSAAV